jgi:putative tryptophan/tyrosine transport system substrate-binding protein
MRRDFHQLFAFLKRFTAITAMVLTAAVVAGAGSCAKPARVYRVGILVGTDSMKGLSDGFRKNMAELGYVEGKNVVYDIQESGADRIVEKRIAEKFVADKVDLVYAFPGQPALAVKTAAKAKIPIVFANAIIGGSDLIDSIRNPGGNITGVRIPNPELTLKSFESLLELKPSTRRVLIVYDTNYPTDMPILAALRPEAAASGVSLLEARVPDPAGIRDVLAGFEKTLDPETDAMLFLPDTVPRLSASAKAVLAFADRHRVPLAGGASSMVKDGTVLTAAADQDEQGKLAAGLADKILKGVPAGSIPVVTTKTYLVINYKKARELGLNPPEGLLKQAGVVIR